MCGIIGVIFSEGKKDLNVVRMCIDGLKELQHRGQESAGVSVGNGKKITLAREMKYVTDLEREQQDQISTMTGFVAIGHVRYSTKGESTIKEAQPFIEDNFSIAHNGTVTNANQLRKKLAAKNIICETTSDTEVIGKMISSSEAATIEDAIIDTCRELHGAYSLVICTVDRLIAVRSPHGIRPLVLARSQMYGDSYMVASETIAFKNMDARLIRTIERNEVCVISKRGIRTHHIIEEPSVEFSKIPSAECSFEDIYVAHPNSLTEYNTAGNGHFWRSFYHIREQMGMSLAREHPMHYGIVSPIPDSGNPYAAGFALESHLPYLPVFTRARYNAPRSFIGPDQNGRVLAVRRKITPIIDEIRGRVITINEDSIVRATTLPVAIKMLRDAGAKEVHVRIGSAPYAHPCYFGIDTPDASDLIASHMTIKEIQDYLEVESLGYLSIESMVKAIGRNPNSLCLACMNGEYKEVYNLDETGKFTLH